MEDKERSVENKKRGEKGKERSEESKNLFFVIPAQAGIQAKRSGPRFRGDDKERGVEDKERSEEGKETTYKMVGSLNNGKANMKYVGRVIGLGLLIGQLVGCSFKPVKLPEMNTYTLDALPPVDKLPHAPITVKTLLVTTSAALPIYQTSNMLYVDKLYQVKSFAKNAWVAPPAEMLLPLMIQSLKNTRHFRAVVAAPFAGLTDYRLELQLLTLQQTFITHPAKLEVALQANLLNSTTNQVIASQRFAKAVVVKHANPYAGVVAANQATQALLVEVAQFVVQHTK